MTGTEDLKRRIQERGVRVPERQSILRTIVEDDAPDELRVRMTTALENVRMRAAKLRKALE